VTQELKEMFSSRTVSIEDRMPEALREWSRRHDGAVPNQAQVFAVRQQVTLLSRESKKDGAVDWTRTRSSGHARKRRARATPRASVEHARTRRRRGRNAQRAQPRRPPERSALAQAARDALETVQRAKAAGRAQS